jgi:hypothetical protein
MTAFLSNGELPIDNNATENELRRLTIGRKNWCAPDVPWQTSGRSPPRDALLVMFDEPWPSDRSLYLGSKLTDCVSLAAK